MADAAFPPSAPPAPGRARALVERGALFAALWLVLVPSVKPGDLAFGLLSAAAATAVSLRVLPPALGSVPLLRALAVIPHFLWQSCVAGVDVARRAFAPAMPLAPGYVRYRTAFPPGFRRCAFTSVTSLLPGSLPVAHEGDTIVYHALDVTTPVAQDLADEERRLGAVLQPTTAND